MDPPTRRRFHAKPKSSMPPSSVVVLDRLSLQEGQAFTVYWSSGYYFPAQITTRNTQRLEYLKSITGNAHTAIALIHRRGYCHGHTPNTHRFEPKTASVMSALTTQGEKSGHFKCGDVRFVLVKGGVCRGFSINWVLVTKTPERDRPRMQGRI